MSRQGAWATRFGIYLAAIGSAFGLGSLWRFPFIVEDNGGGAFVILYIFLVIIIGVPLLIGELLIGKVTRRGVFAAQRQLAAQRRSQSNGEKPRVLIRMMPWVAIFSLFSAVLILGYYSVVSGWVLHFLWQFLKAPFAINDELMVGIGTNLSQLVTPMSDLQQSGVRQLILTVIHLGAVFLVVVKGVEEGIERWVGFIMPIFVGILFVLVFKSMSMPTNKAALQFFLYPDFSRLHISSLGSAVGQLCFTLSIGFATMVTFGSYLRDESLVPRTGFRVATMDSLTAIIAGLLIFPLVMGSPSKVQGPLLLFSTVPEFLLQIPGGIVFGIFFFLCLYLAALGASISILETVVANICESSNLKRQTATLWAVGASLVVSVLAAFSSTSLSRVQVAGRGLLEIMDLILIDWALPISALVFSQIVVYEVSEKVKRDEFLAIGGPSSEILYSHWRFLMKWVVPPIILLALALQFVELIKN